MNFRNLPALDAYHERAHRKAERKMILNALQKTRWNATKAAQLLGVTFRSLRYRMKDHGITR